MDNQLFLKELMVLVRVASSGAYQQNKGNKGNGGKNNTYNNNTSGFGKRDTSLLVCKFCSRKHKFGRGACPAWGKSCLKCGGQNHFASVCTKQQTKPTTNSIASEGGEDEEFPFTGVLFLGSLETGAALQVDRVQGGNQESWEIWLPGNNGKLKFKIDTGAEVSVIGTKQLKIFNKQIMDLTKTRKTLIGPDQKPLSCHGVFQQKFTIGSTSGIAQLYVCDNLKTALLGRPELKKFKLVSIEIPAENDIACDSVQHKTKNIQKEFSSVFTGLGTIKGNPIHIEVEPNTVPYHIGAPRRVAIPFLEPLKKELERMQKLGVIRAVDEPTEWCHPIVLVEKANGDLRICIDLTKLNKNTKREFYELVSYGLKQIIDSPTRITINTRTLIDVALTTQKNNIADHIVTPLSLSDHELIGISRKLNIQKFQPRKILCRDYSKYDKETFKQDLRNAPWINVIAEKSFNKAWSLF